MTNEMTSSIHFSIVLGQELKQECKGLPKILITDYDELSRKTKVQQTLCVMPDSFQAVRKECEHEMKLLVRPDRSVFSKNKQKLFFTSGRQQHASGSVSVKETYTDAKCNAGNTSTCLKKFSRCVSREFLAVNHQNITLQPPQIIPRQKLDVFPSSKAGSTSNLNLERRTHKAKPILSPSNSSTGIAHTAHLKQLDYNTTRYKEKNLVIDRFNHQAFNSQHSRKNYRDDWPASTKNTSAKFPDVMRHKQMKGKKISTLTFESKPNFQETNKLGCQKSERWTEKKYSRRIREGTCNSRAAAD